MKGSFFISLAAGILLFQSCFFPDEGGQVTKVTGTLINEITGEPLQNIPVVIVECSNKLNFQGPMCDDFMTVHTDKDGLYEMVFTTAKRYNYKFGIGRNDKCWAESIDHDGTILKEGETNKIDLTSIPYKVLQVDIKTSKNNKNYLSLDFQQGFSYGRGGRILIDTVTQNTFIDTTLFLKVLPQQDYQIRKYLCHRKGIYIQDYVYSECEPKILPEFHFGYIDTVKVTVE